jgi:hypothetical protein
MKYVGNNSLAYFWSKITGRLAQKQDVISSTNKLDYGLLDNTPTIPTKTSELDNDAHFMPSMFIAKYGITTYAEVLDAYSKGHIVYCRASTGSNPGSGSQLRMAFLAYVNNETNPTEFEFQYYRTLNSHTETNQGDEVYIYKLNKNNGWSLTLRKTYTKIETGTGITYTFTTGNTPKIKLQAKEPYNTTETVVGTWVDGSDLYRKVFAVNNLPDTSDISVSTGVSNATVINIYGYFTNGNETYPVNSEHPDLGGGVYISTTNVGSQLKYSTTFDASQYSGHVVIEYIKNS